MGTNRVEGRPKKKSIKSKVTSRDNMKKRMSRMGKKIKKGLMGPSTDFMTRSSVLKKLQITLKDFRRLCILKGIYPRVPEKAPKGSDKVYYDIKDIAYLSHEPLLHKFREFKAFMKKIRREAGRYQFAEARRKNELKPVMQLDHLVKERYPRFIDALRDLDDCLSMIHLFAAMPSIGRITAEKTRHCSELARHWQYYIARTRSLQKVFVSVKGVYFQAVVLGETITWLVPHQFAQAVPRDIDMRVMATFLEFYEVFLKFTLFKLYNMQGLQYPPKTDKSLHEAGCFLLSIRTVSLDGSLASETTLSTDVKSNNTNNTNNTNNQSHNNELKGSEGSKKKNQPKNPETEKRMKSLYEKLDALAEKADEDADDNDADDDDNDDGPSISGPLSDSLQGLFPTSDDNDNEQDDNEKKTFAMSSEGSGNKDLTNKIFSKFKFFINRELPLDWMQLCIISFGGQVGWEGVASPFGVDDAGITHHVVDRPIQGQQNKTREYIQPQWVFDCINAGILLPTARYGPGVVLPPHLSPFVDDKKEGYVPKYKEEVLKIKSSIEVIKSMSSSISDEAAMKIAMKEQLSDDEEDEQDESTYQKNLKKGKNGKNEKSSKKTPLPKKNATQGDDSDGDDSKEPEQDIDLNKGTKGVVYKPSQKKQSEDDEAAELSHIMMSKKTKRLYGRMQHGIEKKQESTRRLEEKRTILEQKQTPEVKVQANVNPKKRPRQDDTKQLSDNKNQSKPAKKTKQVK